MTGRENLRYTAAQRHRAARTPRSASTSCSSRSGLTEPATTRVDTTRAACASASAWPTRWSRSRRSSSSTSRRPRSTRPAWSRCSSCAAARAESGLAVLLSSHLLNQVQQVCDRVGIFVERQARRPGLGGRAGRPVGERGRPASRSASRASTRSRRPQMAKVLGVIDGVAERPTAGASSRPFARRAPTSDCGAPDRRPAAVDAGTPSSICAARRRARRDLPLRRVQARAASTRARRGGGMTAIARRHRATPRPIHYTELDPSSGAAAAAGASSRPRSSPTTPELALPRPADRPRVAARSAVLAAGGSAPRVGRASGARPCSCAVRARSGRCDLGPSRSPSGFLAFLAPLLGMPSASTRSTASAPRARCRGCSPSRSTATT